MYELTKEFRFEAAHHLPDHDGACRNVHGHSWRVRVTVGNIRLHTDGPKAGMLADYSDISAVMKPLIAKLDHTNLNDMFNNPTSETLAAWIHMQVKGEIIALVADAWLRAWHGHGPASEPYVKITVFETDSSSCTFF